MDCILTYAPLVRNMNLGMGTKQASKHLDDLEAEMLTRGILTEANVERLNS